MTAISATAFHHPDTRRAAPAAAGFATRLYRAILAARQRRADRDIAEILARRGGSLARADAPAAGLPAAASDAFPFGQLRSLQGR